MENNKLRQNEPAFAKETVVIPKYIEGGGVIERGSKGMSKRFYAAIKLKVSDSGEEWLDDMIRKANRRDAACAAMQGMLGNGRYSDTELNNSIPNVIELCYNVADELLKQENL